MKKQLFSVFLFALLAITNSLWSQENPTLNQKVLDQNYFWNKERLSAYLSNKPTDSEDYEGNLKKGLELINRTQFEHAIPLFRKAIAIENSYRPKANATNFGNINLKQNPYPYFYIGICKTNLNQPDSAIFYFQKAFDLDRTFEASLNEIGSIYLKLEDYSEATNYFERAYAINQRSTNALYNLALTHYLIKNYKSSKKYLSKLKKLDPNHEMGLILLGTIYNQMFNYPKAKSIFTKAIKANPNSIPAYYYRGLTKSYLGYNKLAYDDFDAAYKIDTTNYYLLVGLGIMNCYLNKKVEGVKLYSNAIKYIRETNPGYRVEPYLSIEMEDLITELTTGNLSPKEEELGYLFALAAFSEKYWSFFDIAAPYFKNNPESIYIQRIYLYTQRLNNKHNLNTIYNLLKKDYSYPKI